MLYSKQLCNALGSLPKMLLWSEWGTDLATKQPHLFPGFHSCSVQLPCDPGNRWSYVKVMQRVANFVFPSTSKHFIGLIQCKISSYTWEILTRRHGWITSVITNLSGLVAWPGGGRGRGDSSLWAATHSSICLSNRYTHMPITQMELCIWVQVPSTCTSGATCTLVHHSRSLGVGDSWIRYHQFISFRFCTGLYFTFLTITFKISISFCLTHSICTSRHKLVWHSESLCKWDGWPWNMMHKNTFFICAIFSQ